MVLRKLLISIVIPVYNVEKYLRECVDKVLAQTYKRLEIILVDDGSQDSSPQICDSYAKSYSNVFVIHQRNGGLSYARNQGLRHASGDYIVFLDSDDYWDDDYAIEALIKEIQSTEDIVLFGYKKKNDESGKIFVTRPCINENEFLAMHNIDERLNYLVKIGMLDSCAWNKLVRKGFLEEHNILFREGVTSEDIEWTAKLLMHCESISCSKETFYIYRQRKKSITSSMSIENIETLAENIEICIEMGRKELLDDSLRYNTYMAYMAYQYATFLLCVHNVKSKKVYGIIERMKKYRYILDYSSNSKVVFFKILYSIVGFRVGNVLSGLYMHWLYNRI